VWTGFNWLKTEIIAGLLQTLYSAFGLQKGKQYNHQPSSMELTCAKPVEMLAAMPGADRCLLMCQQKSVAMDNRLQSPLFVPGAALIS
jgi:hypothetical protein